MYLTESMILKIKLILIKPYCKPHHCKDKIPGLVKLIPIPFFCKLSLHLPTRINKMLVESS